MLILHYKNSLGLLMCLMLLGTSSAFAQKSKKNVEPKELLSSACKKAIDSFIRQYPTYKPSQEQLARIARGARDAQILATGGNKAAIQTGTTAEYLSSITDLLWYLFAIALNKGQGFASGTFVLEDPGFGIYNFLLDYVKRVYGAKNLTKEVTFSLKKAYPRRSTHFNDYYIAKGFTVGQTKRTFFGLGKSKTKLVKDPTYTHYGIDLTNPLLVLPPDPAIERKKEQELNEAKKEGDVKLEEIDVPEIDEGEPSAEELKQAAQAEKATPKKPGTASHILFGKVNQAESLIFIKPESHGLHITDVGKHGWNLIKSKLRKISAKLANKYSDTWLGAIFKNATTDDEPYYRKERVPLADMAEFNAIITPDEGPSVASKDAPVNQAIDAAMKKVKGLGIQAIDAYAQAPTTLNLKLSQAQQKQLKDLADKLAKRYDNIIQRVGREVIVTANDIQRASGALAACVS